MWFFCDEGADIFRGPKLYSSIDWDNKKREYVDPQVGEVPGASRPWRDGSKPFPIGWEGNKICGPREFFEQGAVLNESRDAEESAPELCPCGVPDPVAPAAQPKFMIEAVASVGVQRNLTTLHNVVGCAPMVLKVYDLSTGEYDFASGRTGGGLFEPAKNGVVEIPFDEPGVFSPGFTLWTNSGGYEDYYGVGVLPPFDFPYVSFWDLVIRGKPTHTSTASYIPHPDDPASSYIEVTSAPEDDDMLTGASGYEIELDGVSQGTLAWTLAGEGIGTLETLNHVALPGIHSVRVRAFNECGQGPWGPSTVFAVT